MDYISDFFYHISICCLARSKHETVTEDIRCKAPIKFGSCDLPHGIMRRKRKKSKKQKVDPSLASIQGPSDYESDALSTEPLRCLIW